MKDKQNGNSSGILFNSIGKMGLIWSGSKSELSPAGQLVILENQVG
jgi:hypothetical protein